MKVKKSGHLRNLYLFGIDTFCFWAIAMIYFVGTRAFGDSPKFDFSTYVINTLILYVLTSAARLALRVYGVVWRFPTTGAYLRVVIADFAAGAVSLVIGRLTDFYQELSVYIVIAAVNALVTLSSRFVYRTIFKHMGMAGKNDQPHINVALVGAGKLGAALVNELLYNPKKLCKPVFFIDVDPEKTGLKISGIPVKAADEDIGALIRDYDVTEVIIAVTDLTNERADELYRHYSQFGCMVKIYDSPVSDMGNQTQKVIREFQIEDLLFRQPVDFTDSAAYRFYAGKKILVTGGGGSIGSELCRQIAKCNPQKLIIFDIYENNAYEIQQELIRTYGDKLDLAVEIGSVRDRKRLNALFMNYQPDIVFHAAAHKHVPLMENCGCEAIKNNVLGTYNTADMAEKYGVKKFILISTDKAVNPTNIMGATKRLCEMVIQCRTDSKTSFSAVRFGNVLGSNGSVIPLFKKQIAKGGPVTITDKRIIRYFMTIPEASQLVMQAGAMAKNGELFVLDMGKPVKIYDLAVNMIRLSGFEPDVDIKIEEIGLRPGEKLYEELLMKSETLGKTENDMIYIEKDTPLTRMAVEDKLTVLKNAVDLAADEIGSDRVKAAIHQVVPTFHEPEEINSTVGDEVRQPSVV